MNSFSWKILAVLALALVVSGCGESGPRLYKAGGTVTYNSQPVEGATVTFAYDNGNFASGATDAAGKFQLIYMGRPGGTVLGKCTVSVAKVAGSGGTPPPAGEKDPLKMMEAMKAAGSSTMQGENNMNTQPKSLIPAKYANASTSGLTFEIKATEKDNDFPIDLKD